MVKLSATIPCFDLNHESYVMLITTDKRLWGLCVLVLAFAVPASASHPRPTPTVQSHAPVGEPAEPPGSGPHDGASAVLQLDDGSAESVFGLTGPGTRQFLFFNRFENPGLFVLEAIQVLFPSGTDVEPGDAIELVVYADVFGDPTAGGAQLRLHMHDVVQTADGVTFSTFDLPEPLEFFTAGDILIGVINRYHDTGADPELTQPAALDTTDPSANSFFALWSGDAAHPPDLASAIEISPLSGQIAGNFMVRGSGRLASVVEVPTLDSVGLVIMAVLLVVAAGVLRWR